MRGRFEEQLEVLHTQMIEMGSLCETAIANAIKSLSDGDIEYVNRAIAADEEIDRMERDIESLCMRLLLQQQPVAKDLRQISSALKMITDMERIGDQASDIAEIVEMDNIKSSDDTSIIEEMSIAAIRMVTDSIDAYVRQDLTLAHAVIDSDDIVDNYFNLAKAQLIELLSKDATKGEYIMDSLMIAKYLERIADHATNIAEWVVYSITGKHEGEKDANLPS